MVGMCCSLRQSVLDGRDDGAQTLNDALTAAALLDDEQNGVIAGDGAQQVRHVGIVDVVGDEAGVAGTRLDDAEVSREVDGQIAWRFQHLASRLIAAYALVHSLVGKHVDVFAVHRRCLCHFQLLEVTAERGLRELETFLFQLLQELFLTAQFLARDEHLECFNSVVFDFHKCINML